MIKTLWIPTGGFTQSNGTTQDYYECDNCNKQILAYRQENHPILGQLTVEEYKFCPHCGAEMMIEY